MRSRSELGLGDESAAGSSWEASCGRILGVGYMDHRAGNAREGGKEADRGILQEKVGASMGTR